MVIIQQSINRDKLISRKIPLEDDRLLFSLPPVGFHLQNIRILLILLFLAVNVAILKYFAVNLADMLKFSLTLILCTLIPGLVFINWLDLYRNQAYKFVLALAIGICIDIIVYIVLALLHLKVYLFIGFPFILIIYLIKQKPGQDIRLIIRTIQGMASWHFYSLLFLASAAVFLVVFFYFRPNPLPGWGQAIFYYIDYPWHLGNIAEIKNHWFPQDPRLAGQPFHYHVFFYVYTAFIANITGISIPVLFFRLQIWSLILLLIGASYYAASRWFKNCLAGVLSVFIFLFSGGCLFSHPYNIFLKNLFFSPTFLLATLLCLIFLIEVRSFVIESDYKILLVVLLLTLGVSGAKGSFFPVLWSGIAGVWLYAWFSRRNVKRMTVLLSSTLLIFSMVFVYIFQGPGGEGFNIVPLEIIRQSKLYEVYLHLLGRNDNKWAILSFIPVYFLAFFSFRCLALFNLLIHLASKVKRMPLDKLFLGLMILASFIPAYLLSYRGGSQYYYLFVGYIGLNLLAAGYISHLFKNSRSRLVQVLVLTLLFLSIGDTWLTINKLNQINSQVAAMNNKPLTPALYAGLSYLRDNTPVNALIGSHRSFQYSADNPRFFYYSAFSERRILVEGWQYMSLAYQQEAQHRNEDMKKLYITHNSRLATKIIRQYDIDYLLVDKHGRQRIRFKTEQLLILKYKNDAVEIYQVVK